MNNDRTYGVEMEIIGNKREVIRNLRRAGIEVNDEGYTHRDTAYWKIVSDSTVRPNRYQTGMTGFELVSPPMKGLDGMLEIKVVCEALRECGTQVNRTCGLHVHHDAGDLTGKDLVWLQRMYIRCETVIDGLHPQSRRGMNQYCQSVKGYQDPQDLGHKINKMSIEDVLTYYHRYDRYGKLNLLAYRRHGTVEFRQAAGTIDPKKILNWVVFTQAMVERVAKGGLKSRTELTSWERVKQTLNLTTYWGGDYMEQAAGEFYNARRQALRA